MGATPLKCFAAVRFAAPARSIPPGGNATLDPVSSLTLVFPAPEVEPGGAEAEATLPKEGRRPTPTPTAVCAPADGRNSTGHVTEVTVTRRHLVRVFRARRFFLLPGGQLCRTNAKIGFFLCLRGRFRNSENRGDVAKAQESRSSISPPLAGVPPSGKSKTGIITNGARFECFAVVGVFSP